MFRSDDFLLPKFTTENCFPCLSSLMVVLKQWDQFHSLSLGHPVLSMCNHYYLQLQIDSKLVFFLVISPIFDTNSFKKKKKPFVKLRWELQSMYIPPNSEKHGKVIHIFRSYSNKKIKSEKPKGMLRCWVLIIVKTKPESTYVKAEREIGCFRTKKVFSLNQKDPVLQKGNTFTPLIMTVKRILVACHLAFS